jgi:hypothetical protein
MFPFVNDDIQIPSPSQAIYNPIQKKSSSPNRFSTTGLPVFTTSPLWKLMSDGISIARSGVSNNTMKKGEKLKLKKIGFCLRDHFLLPFLSPLTLKVQMLLSKLHPVEDLQLNIKPTSKSLLASLPSQESVTCMSVSDDGLVLAVGTSRGRMCMFSFREDVLKEKGTKDIGGGGGEEMGGGGEDSNLNIISQNTHCGKCNTKFGITTRRHRCKECGHSFCSSCLSHKIYNPSLGIVKVPDRVCDNCYRVCYKYLTSNSFNFFFLFR